MPSFRPLWFLLLMTAVGIVSGGEPSARSSDSVLPALRDGERVVLLGGTLFETDRKRGEIETALTLRYADRAVSFRNLGWAGDSVWAESRGVFDRPEQGYRRMIELLGDLDPDVVILSYGRAEALAGTEPKRFAEGLRKLIGDVRGLGARVVLLTPHRAMPAPPPLPEPTAHNSRLKPYVNVIREVARTETIPLIDLFPLEPTGVEKPTTNGVHLTPNGLRWLAGEIAMRFVTDRKPNTNPNSEVIEKLRVQIVEKNRLHEQQWRPPNVTYLLLFRKHEQGNNAAELAEYDRFIRERETRIDRLRRELSR